MDINKSKLAIVSLFLITIIFWFLPLTANAASRGISVISDLNHKSGKLGAYKALIIGINDYEDPKIPDLDTAVNDANAMAKLLRERYGFKVELLLDRKATRKAIYQALMNLASSAKPDDNVLIYYAGHGDVDRITDDGWWIPSDAKGGDPVTYLDNFLVQKYIRSMQARHVLLISDSCYSGTLFGQARAMPPIINDKYYLNLYNEKSRWGMTSGNKTPVSDRGTGNHSVFAYQLLKELRKNEKPYVSTQEIYTHIAPIISNNSEQTPLCRPIRNTGDQGGEFVFVASGTVGTDSVNDTKKADTGLDAERKRLEQERKELERIKAEIEEHSKLEAERKQLEAEKKKLIEKKVSKYSPISPEKDNRPVHHGSGITQYMGFTMDFETGDLRGWKKTGTAFDYQPTLDDNPTARRRGQPSNHQGRYWIGGYEKYQGKPGQRPGNIQGDRPQGTLTSPSFTIPSGPLSFLVGGGSSMNTRIELLVSGRSVLQASGRNTETMHRVTWDLSPYAGQTGQIRIVDNASGGWGHINVDDLNFSGYRTDNRPVHHGSGIAQYMGFTMDFETGDLRGWEKTGTAFDYQPTLGDNPTARRRGQPSNHQGRYWIGGYEKYQGKPGQRPGNIQGDGPQGTLTSPSFTIPSGSLSFLVGGGRSMNTRIELLVSGRSVLQASGRNTETMHRVTWDLSPYAGQTGHIRIVDNASAGWGHINVDDLKFSSF